jgi:hypothetical protein
VEAKVQMRDPRSSSSAASLDSRSRALGSAARGPAPSLLRVPQTPILLEILEAIAHGSHGPAASDFATVASRMLIALSGVFDIFVAIVSGLRGKYNAQSQICGSVEVHFTLKSVHC